MFLSFWEVLDVGVGGVWRCVFNVEPPVAADFLARGRLQVSKSCHLGLPGGARRASFLLSLVLFGRGFRLNLPADSCCWLCYLVLAPATVLSRLGWPVVLFFCRQCKPASRLNGVALPLPGSGNNPFVGAALHDGSPRFQRFLRVAGGDN